MILKIYQSAVHYSKDTQNQNIKMGYTLICVETLKHRDSSLSMVKWDQNNNT